MAPIPQTGTRPNSTKQKSETQALSAYPVGVQCCPQLPQALAPVAEAQGELRLIPSRLLASMARVLPGTVQRMLAQRKA
jgi:hypothetical protein